MRAASQGAGRLELQARRGLPKIGSSGNPLTARMTLPHIDHHDVSCLDRLRHKISAGADVNRLITSSYTPLGMAAKFASPEACLLLLDAGANVDLCSAQGDSPLSVALSEPAQQASHGKVLSVVALLLERGANPDGNPSCLSNPKPWQIPIVQACQFEHVEAISLLARHGANVDVEFSQGSGSNSTPLSLAFQFKKESAVLHLLDAGARELDERDRGLRPVHAALLSDMPRVIEHLLRFHDEDPTKLLSGTDDVRLVVSQNMRDLMTSVWQAIQSEKSEGVVLGALEPQENVHDILPARRRAVGPLL
jgi:ankyrin repeat protein